LILAVIRAHRSSGAGLLSQLLAKSNRVQGRPDPGGDNGKTVELLSSGALSAFDGDLALAAF